MAAPRIDAKAARRDMESPDGAMLVCAYDDEAKCGKYRLEGSVSLSTFQAREGSVPKDREVIFYCA